MLSAREEMAKDAPSSPIQWDIWYMEAHPQPAGAEELAQWHLDRMVAWSFTYADAMLEAHAKAQQ